MLLCCMHACMDACTSLEIFGMDSFHLRTNNYSQFEYGISKILRQIHLATNKFETWETKMLSENRGISQASSLTFRPIGPSSVALGSNLKASWQGSGKSKELLRDLSSIFMESQISPRANVAKSCSISYNLIF